MIEELSPVERKFILHWGEMGTRWGVNRTVAQIHALLYISPRPLNAEEISARLGVARSNVSTSLRELQGWGIVRLTHLPDDRRDHFESMQDVWEMFRVVIEERKKREIDPTVRMLGDCIAEAGHDKKAGAHTRQKLEELLGFFQTSMAVYSELRDWPTPALVKLLRHADRLRKVIGLAKPLLRRTP
ncbi:MAG TPA: MarR family transcriptional regulator [Terriglobia bacterium]|nr:MarR family transcriptional regulator [Terriglobia bacterium]